MYFVSHFHITFLTPAKENTANSCTVEFNQTVETDAGTQEDMVRWGGKKHGRCAAWKHVRETLKYLILLSCFVSFHCSCYLNWSKHGNYSTAIPHHLQWLHMLFVFLLEAYSSHPANLPLHWHQFSGGTAPLSWFLQGSSSPSVPTLVRYFLCSSDYVQPGKKNAICNECNLPHDRIPGRSCRCIPNYIKP